MTAGQNRILVVDDDPDFLAIAEFILGNSGFEYHGVKGGGEALAALEAYGPDVVLLDQQLGPENGLDLIDPIRAKLPEVPVVLVTAHSTIEIAVEAIKRGAHDFLEKPLDEARVLATLSGALNHRRLVDRLKALEEAQARAGSFEGMVGSSPQMQTVFRTIENVAPTDASVMIIGESGTGKELVARAIHQCSKRSGGAFVAVNMGAVPNELTESVLFGHERGAFTGADKQRIGCCEEASQGTLFLDEICEMPIETQPKLLRFLQEKTLRRVGGSRDIVSEARIVSATNTDPLQDVRDQRLRGDLYYRLNVVPIRMPALREREGDLQAIARHALAQASERYDKEFERWEESALDRLARHRWPGNVRQLIHVVERIVILNQGPVVTADMIPADLDQESIESPTAPATSAAAPDPSESAAAAVEEEHEVIPMARVEQLAIERAIKSCGSAAKAARALGISEATIYRRLREYGIGSDES